MLPELTVRVPRALHEDDLLARAEKFHLKGASYDEVNKALHTAMEAASKDDMIIVCGSVFVVGEVELKTGN